MNSTLKTRFLLQELSSKTPAHGKLAPYKYVSRLNFLLGAEIVRIGRWGWGRDVAEAKPSI